jgi:hypothetical protein
MSSTRPGFGSRSFASWWISVPLPLGGEGAGIPVSFLPVFHTYLSGSPARFADARYNGAD